MDIYEQDARCNFSQISEPILFQYALECKESCQAMNNEIKAPKEITHGSLLIYWSEKKMLVLCIEYKIKRTK